MNKNSNTEISRLKYVYFLIIPFLISCTTSRIVVDTKDLSYLYNPTKNRFYPRYNVTNQSDDFSDLSVKFFADQLLFSEANPQGVPMAQMIITAKLFNISRGRTLADTAIYNINIIKEEERPEYIYTIPLRVSTGQEYEAEVKILDKLRNEIVQSFVPFNTLTYNNRYNYRALGHFSGNQLFNPVVKSGELLNLIYLRKPVDSIFISYYKQFTEIPDPPSMILPERTIDYGPDTIIALPYSDTSPLSFSMEGIYMLRSDKETDEGYTLLNLGPAFPEMNTPETMIEPLAYLATQNELDSLRSAVRKKVALDEFWIKCGGNVEKARELIRIFYTRVLYSNYYFTSYKEGWRTERGMIYIMYGPHDK
ncbi:MAG: GWxTD domain-containing protein, partial [Bacteroidales bacterium]|nr:GWxTD domain-containing protein [Bacteroidales bacterium]